MISNLQAPLVEQFRTHPDRLIAHMPATGSIRHFLDSVFIEVYQARWLRPESVHLFTEDFERFSKEMFVEVVQGSGWVREGTTPTWCKDFCKYMSPCGTVNIVKTNSIGYIMFSRDAPGMMPVMCLLKQPAVVLEWVESRGVRDGFVEQEPR